MHLIFHSHLFAFLGGGSMAPWYEYLLSGVAIIIVWPVTLLEEIGRIEVTWKHVIWLEVIACTVMFGGSFLIKLFHPKFSWWFPIVMIACMAVGRLLIWTILYAFKGETGDE